MPPKGLAHKLDIPNSSSCILRFKEEQLSATHTTKTPSGTSVFSPHVNGFGSQVTHYCEPTDILALIVFLSMPGERIELSWISPHDFESCASTNSAIPAFTRLV